MWVWQYKKGMGRYICLCGCVRESISMWAKRRIYIYVDIELQIMSCFCICNYVIVFLGNIQEREMLHACTFSPFQNRQYQRIIKISIFNIPIFYTVLLHANIRCVVIMILKIWYLLTTNAIHGYN